MPPLPMRARVTPCASALAAVKPHFSVPRALHPSSHPSLTLRLSVFQKLIQQTAGNDTRRPPPAPRALPLPLPLPMSAPAPPPASGLGSPSYHARLPGHLNLGPIDTGTSLDLPALLRARTEGTSEGTAARTRAEGSAAQGR